MIHINMKKYFLTKLFVFVTVLFTSSCTDLFDGFFEDDEAVLQKDIDKYFTQEQQDKANTAKDASYITKEEKKVIFYCNLARLDGKAYMNAMLGDLQNSDDYYVRSLVETLDTIKDLPMLYPNEQLCKAAEAHANDMGATGDFTHDSSDGTPYNKRIAKYYKGKYTSENLAGGSNEAYFIVNLLLIDQYTPSYGHRKNILSKKFSRIGVAIRDHAFYTYICVQDFSDDAGDKK